MRLATIRTESGTSAVRLDGDDAVPTGHRDVGELLNAPGWSAAAAAAGGPPRAAADVDFAALVPRPGKIICVGLNYRNHIIEMGRDLPDHPTLFAKFPEAIIADGDAIEIDAASEAWDWEAELAVVIGGTARRCSPAEAAAAIAGFSIINDVTARDFQNRTPQWLQGKTFEHTAPLGPVLVTPDELDGGVRPRLELSCSVGGDVVQRSSTSDLVFDPVVLVEYISRVVTLHPGDVIATGTPGGVGHARQPPRYLADGDVVVTEIEGLGTLTNVARVP